MLSPLIYKLMGLEMACAVLHIGAHPDDEDIGLLAYLARKYGVRAVYWSATRGEGGQNRIGPYKDEALGIYRTWESLAARAVDGGECLFGPFYDYGYTKNADEALAKWGRETLIREVVRAIRLIQPGIIVARWKGTPGDFHGQHQAVGQATLEAFEAAGDPNRFPELKAQGLAAWQPLKLYHSTDNSGGDQALGGAVNIHGTINPDFEKEGILRINTGEFDPISGITYQEMAWMAYINHKTQAIGVAPAPGDFFYYFSLYKSRVPVAGKETTFFDGLNPTLTGLVEYPGNGSQYLQNNLEEIKSLTKEALYSFRADDPMKSSESLFKALFLLREIREGLAKARLSSEAEMAINLYLTRKIADFEKITARCMGLELEGLSEHLRMIPGEKIRVSARLWNHRGYRIDNAEFKLSFPEAWEARPLEPEGSDKSPSTQLKTMFEVKVSKSADLTCPYWLVKPRKPYTYNWPEGEPCARPFSPSPVMVNCEVTFGQNRIKLQKSVVFREAFAGGFRELPLVVIPPISLHPKTSCEFLPFSNAEQSLELLVVARNNSESAIEGNLELIVPTGWKVDPGGIQLSLTEKGETKTVRHTVSVPADISAGHYPLQYKIRHGKQEYAAIVTPVYMGSPGLPAPPDESSCVAEEFIISPSRVMVHLIDAQFVQKLRYAYVQGAKEELLETLKPFGISFHLITDEEMGYIDLDSFDAVVIGPNAYLIREEVRKYAARFLEYVKQGGTLVVQYQGYRYQTESFTPYPFKYSQPHDRVTYEDAPVKILNPDHLLFCQPNSISSKDFDGWIRERGLYFFGEWDKRYNTLLSCSDPGEEPKEGGLLECQYGQGNFIYTGYSFFRQLPAGVPGAFRLFANILALPEARILERIEFLKKIYLFSTLNEEQLDTVARIMSEQWVDDGEYICRQGEEGDVLYIIYRGIVEVIKKSGDQEEVIYIAQKGECLGEMAILGDIPRTASLRARGDVELLIIGRSSFVSILYKNPDMSIQMMKLLINRLASSTGK